MNTENGIPEKCNELTPLGKVVEPGGFEISYAYYAYRYNSTLAHLQNRPLGHQVLISGFERNDYRWINIEKSWLRPNTGMFINSLA